MSVCLNVHFALLFFQDEKFDEEQGPTIFDLVFVEDVDILPYMAWQHWPGVDKKKELVRVPSFFRCAFYTAVGDDRRLKFLKIQVSQFVP